MKKQSIARFGKTILSLLLAAALLACASCKKAQTANTDGSGETTAAKKEIVPAKVDSIDLEYDEGILKYVRFEKASAHLTTKPRAYLFVFEYTNKQETPSQMQGTFRLNFYQNGVEVDQISGVSNAGEQSDLLDAFFKEALQNGKITFAKLVQLVDDSPVTIYAKHKDEAKHTSQMMEVDLNAPPATEQAATDTATAAAAALNLGDTASTNIIDFRLEKAQFAITADSSYPADPERSVDDYCQPVDNPTLVQRAGIFNASVGTTYVCMTFHVSNKDRGGLNMGGDPGCDWPIGMSVIYKGQRYTVHSFDLNNKTGYQGDGLRLDWSAVSSDGSFYKQHKSTNMILQAGCGATIRTLGVVTMEPDALTDGFELEVSIVDAVGDYTSYVYQVG